MGFCSQRKSLAILSSPVRISRENLKSSGEKKLNHGGLEADSPEAAGCCSQRQLTVRQSVLSLSGQAAQNASNYDVYLTICRDGWCVFWVCLCMNTNGSKP